MGTLRFQQELPLTGAKNLAVYLFLLVEFASTSQQHEPIADHKTDAAAEHVGRR